jgi:hypothetical protein
MYCASQSIIGTAAILIMMVVSVNGATAQNPETASSCPAAGLLSPQESTVRLAILPAPVGHRQPKQSDIPSNVQKAESDVDRNVSEFDRTLRICRNCDFGNGRFGPSTAVARHVHRHYHSHISFRDWRRF